VPKDARLQHARHVAAAQELIGEGVGFVLDHVALLDVAGAARLALHRIADRLVEPFVVLRQEERTPLLRQRDAARDRLEEVLLGAAAGENQQRSLIAQDAKRLHEVEDQRFLAVVVGVQKANVGVEAGADAGFFDERMQNAVGVIEHRVKASWAGWRLRPVKRYASGTSWPMQVK